MHFEWPSVVDRLVRLFALVGHLREEVSLHWGRDLFQRRDLLVLLGHRGLVVLVDKGLDNRM